MARTRELRERLQPWSEKHKDLLRTMLRADAGNRKTLNILWEMSPVVPIPGDMTDSSRKIQHADISKPIPYELFCGRIAWERSWKFDRPLSQEEQRSFAESAKFLQERRDFYWRKYRDVPFLMTPNNGIEQILLFVSGRIVVKEWPADVQKRLKEKRTTLLDEGCDFREVEAPYSFLR